MRSDGGSPRTLSASVPRCSWASDPRRAPRCSPRSPPAGWTWSSRPLAGGRMHRCWPRLRPALPGGGRQEWLAVTGTNGKTTTVRMLACMLTAAGYRSLAVGNVGTSVVDAVTAADPCPVLAVELSSFQLHWSSTVAPFAAVVLNVAGHHLDWHGDIESYAADKGRIYGPGTVAVCNADDARTRQLAAAAPGPARVVAFRRDAPGPGELGVADGSLVDRAVGDGAFGDG